jgi:hypothetical protein
MDKDVFIAGILVALMVLVLGSAASWGWYQAGVQQEVYERQGIKMTRWEVFIGAKPAVKVVP